MRKYVLVPSEHYQRLLKDSGINQIESPVNGVVSETSLKPTKDTALEDIKKTSNSLKESTNKSLQEEVPVDVNRDFYQEITPQRSSKQKLVTPYPTPPPPGQPEYYDRT